MLHCYCWMASWRSSLHWSARTMVLFSFASLFFFYSCFLCRCNSNSMPLLVSFPSELRNSVPLGRYLVPVGDKTAGYPPHRE